jgi:predicted metalloendopeptidase
MGIQIGTTLTNITMLEDLYFPLDTHKGDFFLNVIQGTSFQSQMEQKELASPSRDSAVLSAFSLAPFRIQFIPTANKIIVPETALQEPVLNLGNSHLPVLYGSVGVKIAEALALAFGVDGGLYWSNGVLMSDKDPKAQETRDLINSRRKCLSSFFTNIRLDDEPYIERTSLDSTMHLAGIQIALGAISNHPLYGEFLALPDLNQYSPTAQFFIAYGQSQCSSSTLLFHDLEHSTFTSLSHDHRTKGVLRQLVGFTKAMECPVSSEMYADFTCDYII